MPDDWTTYIKDVKPSAKDLDKLGTDYWSLWQYFKNHNIYFLAVSKDDTSTIMLTKYMGAEAGFLYELSANSGDIAKENITAQIEQYQSRTPGTTIQDGTFIPQRTSSIILCLNIGMTATDGGFIASNTLLCMMGNALL